MVVERSGCNYCFKTLDPQDKDEALRFFVKCNNCGQPYHVKCWNRCKKCLHCEHDQVQSIQIESPLPLHVVKRTQAIPITPLEIATPSRNWGVIGVVVVVVGVILALLLGKLSSGPNDITLPTTTTIEQPMKQPVTVPSRATSPTDTQLPKKTAPKSSPSATAEPTAMPALIVLTPRANNEMGVIVEVTAGLVISGMPVPTPVVPIDLPPDSINVLLLGTDARPGEKLGHTDTIIIASINPKTNYVTLLSIPRDLYVFIPGLNRFDRINTVEVYASRAKIGKPVELLAEAIHYNLGIPVHYYARIDFSGVREIIDRVDGVDVLAHCPLYDVFPDLPPGINDIFTDTVQLSTVPTGTISIPVPGLYNLDGQHALWFARSRYSTSDFDRSRRQQAVLRALWSKIKAQGLVGQLPTLWNDVTKIVDTNLNVNDVAYLASFGLQLDDARIKQRSIDNSALRSFTTATGAQVLGIVPERVQLVIDEAFTPPLSNVASQAAAQVEVINGSGRKNWELLATDRLTSQGFIVPSYSVSDQPITRTQIINYQTTSKGSRINQLLRVFNLKPDRVINQPTENSQIAFQLLIGPDFDSCKSPTALIAFPTHTVMPEGGVPPTAIPNTTYPTATSQISYVVRYGDTLWSIGTIFGVSVEALKAANHLTGSSIIAISQVLTIPNP